MSSGQTGFSYIEVLVATVLISMMLIPALDALQPGLQGSELHRQRVEGHYALQGKMEEVLAESFADLDIAATVAGSSTIPTTYSDATPDGIPRNVFIWRYDVDNADGDGNVLTDGEDDILWISVSLAESGQSLQTLRNRF